MSALEPMHVLAARSFARTKLPNNASMYFPVEKKENTLSAFLHGPTVQWLLILSFGRQKS